MQRLVRVARHDHRVAGAREGQQQRVHAAGRPVDEKPAAFAAPGFGGQTLGGLHEVGRLAHVLDPAGHRDVDAEQRHAEDLAHRFGRALALLVARRVELGVAARAIAQDRVGVGGRPLVLARRAAGSVGGGRLRVRLVGRSHCGSPGVMATRSGVSVYQPCGASPPGHRRFTGWSPSLTGGVPS